MQISITEIICKIVLGNAVNVIVHRGEQVRVGISANGYRRILRLTGDKARNEGAVCFIDIVFECGTASCGYIGKTVFNGLNAGL